MVKRILVIDDDESVRTSFTLALEDLGLQVDTAESGEMGIKKVQGEGYDLIFLDLKMPGMNGIETLCEIRRIDEKTPIYIVTAFHKEYFDGIKTAAEDGMAFEVLKKPLGSEEIRMVTKSILGVEDAKEVCNV